jgi:hypothetical protein
VTGGWLLTWRREEGGEGGFSLSMGSNCTHERELGILLKPYTTFAVHFIFSGSTWFAWFFFSINSNQFFCIYFASNKLFYHIFIVIKIFTRPKKINKKYLQFVI